MRARWICLGLAALFVAMAITPVAAGDHCRTKLAIYSRVALEPAPPHLAANGTLCAGLFGDSVVNDHTLMPGATQVFVRVNGDFGASVPFLVARLDGLGFSGQHYVLERGLSPGGSLFVYQMSAWVDILDPEDGDTLTASVLYPSGLLAQVTYKVSPLTDPDPLA